MRMNGAEGATTAPRKVLLINPPRFNELIGKNPAIVEKHRGFNPPLGLLPLAGYVEATTKHSIDIIDAQPVQPFDAVHDQDAGHEPDEDR